MTTIDPALPTLDDPPAPPATDIAEVVADARHGFATLRRTGTLPDGGAVTAAERIAGTDEVLVLTDDGTGADLRVERVRLDTVGERDLAAVLAAHPDLTTVVDLRSPNLVAWALTGEPLPIRYVPVQRWTLASTLPTSTDPRETVTQAVAAALAADPYTPALLVAGAGGVVWGRKGLLRTLEYAQLVEEGAQFQLLAEPLGGSRPVGPGVLLQQWRMSGLEDEARAAGRLPTEG